jgi:hypothetical protein
MRSLFRRCERARVRYLLIGGQAAVHYGAQFFTEDHDLWIAPQSENVRRFLQVLASIGARVYKLTPPLTQRNLRAGHGFHFLLGRQGGAPVYLDVMGRPPDAPPFAVSLRRAERGRTPWGVVPIVAIEDLVEMKKTDRPEDYDVVSRLARIRLERETAPSARLVRWALANAWTSQDVLAILERYGSLLKSLPHRLRRLYEQSVRDPDGARESLDRLLWARRMRAMLRRRRYWRRLLAELRELHRRGALLPQDAPVSAILPAR